MFKELVLNCFNRVEEAYRLLVDGRSVLEEGEASGSLNNDRELKADTLIGEIASQLIAQDPKIKYVLVEGRKPPCYMADKNGLYLVGIDPLDGSLAYEKAELSAGAPFTFVVTIAKVTEGKDVLFKDIVAAGVFDFRQGGCWFAEETGETIVRRDKAGAFVRARPETATAVDLGKQFVIFESYYPETRELAAKAFAQKKGYLRSFCSAAWEMAMVSSGDFAAQFCLSQKHHELGATRLLVTQAGGIVVNARTSEPLDDLVWARWKEDEKGYDWNMQTPEITACSKAYANDLLSILKPHIR